MHKDSFSSAASPSSPTFLSKQKDLAFRGPAVTHLHDVVDQRVAEHPVQVDALVLQNVLGSRNMAKRCYTHCPSLSAERAHMFVLGSNRDTSSGQISGNVQHQGLQDIKE